MGGVRCLELFPKKNRFFFGGFPYSGAHGVVYSSEYWIEKGYRRKICCNFHFLPKVYWSYSTPQYVAIFPIEKLPFYSRQKIWECIIWAVSFSLYIRVWNDCFTVMHNASMWGRVESPWPCAPQKIESQWLLNIVDFQESGRNSNQVVGELPTSALWKHFRVWFPCIANFLTFF